MRSLNVGMPHHPTIGREESAIKAPAEQERKPRQVNRCLKRFYIIVLSNRLRDTGVKLKGHSAKVRSSTAEK
jgi:hypothetical protein